MPPSRRHFLASAGLTAAALSTARADDPPLAPPDKQPPELQLPDPPGRTVGWAVVGLGKLALEEVLPAFKLCKYSKPTALVSGHPEKARRVAAAYGVDPKSIYDYANYDKIADNPAVDVVYVILPNSMHAEYTVRGLAAKKHVLCEKPMAPTAGDCQTMIAAGKEHQRLLMVAYRLRYEPFHVTAIDLCRKGELGKIKSLTASNCQNVTAPNIRLSRSLAGGPMEDIGIYCLNAARYLTSEEPSEVMAAAHQPKDDPRFREVAESVAFTLKFPSGAIASLDCSFGTAESRHLHVHGSGGVLGMANAFAYRGQRLTLSKEGRESELKLQPVNHFASEMDHFSECVLSGRAPRTPGEEGLADVRVIEAVAEAARTGRAVKLV